MAFSQSGGEYCLQSVVKDVGSACPFAHCLICKFLCHSSNLMIVFERDHL